MSASLAAGRRSTPSRPGRRARSICATSAAGPRGPRWRIDASSDRERAGHDGQARIARRIPAAGADARVQDAVRALSRPAAKMLACNRRRVRRRLRGFRLHRGRRHADICAVGPVGGKAHTPQEYLGSIASSRARRRSRWRSSGRASINDRRKAPSERSRTPARCCSFRPIPAMRDLHRQRDPVSGQRSRADKISKNDTQMRRSAGRARVGASSAVLDAASE